MSNQVSAVASQLEVEKKKYVTEECDTQLIESIRRTFRRSSEEKDVVLLVVQSCDNLYDSFLKNLDSPDDRQGYTCNACRRFVEQFGRIVAVQKDGTKVSAMWNPEDVPEKFQKAVRSLKKFVEACQIEGVFYTSESQWGIPKTGEWTHFSVRPTNQKKYAPKSALLTPFQAYAEKSEDRRMLLTAMYEFKIDVVKKAHALLSSESLYRGEKCLGVAEWFLQLHKSLDAEKNKDTRVNMTWYAVATAPPGYCHIRSTMIGTLLEDLAAGLPTEDASRKFSEKMNPLQYRRPTAAPSSGQIDAAEKIVEKLGIAKSLDRRYARLDEIKALWTPRVVENNEGSKDGVFSHLRKDNKKKDVQPSGALTKPITWEKFRRTVLINADKIEVEMTRAMDLYAFMTAADMTSPPIVQWDSAENRNPVTWYTYAAPTNPVNWNLESDGYCEVDAVTLFPQMWNDENKFKHVGNGVLFVLKNCRDTRDDVTMSLFPELLRSDLNGIRSVVEAHSKSGRPERPDGSLACGVAVRSGVTDGRFKRLHVRVTSDGISTMYAIDRWD
jgi:hypothetical protein